MAGKHTNASYRDEFVQITERWLDDNTINNPLWLTTEDSPGKIHPSEIFLVRQSYRKWMPRYEDDQGVTGEVVDFDSLFSDWWRLPYMVAVYEWTARDQSGNEIWRFEEGYRFSVDRNKKLGWRTKVKPFASCFRDKHLRDWVLLKKLGAGLEVTLGRLPSK